MTPEQEAQFAEFGCAARCLLWYSNHYHTRDMTKEQFIDEFSLNYPASWIRGGKCGLTNTGTMLEIAKKLDLATSLQVYRSPNRVRDDIRAQRSNTICLITENRPPDWDDFIHCRIVASRRLEPDRWTLLEVNDQIELQALPLIISDADLNLWGAYFCVFYHHLQAQVG